MDITINVCFYFFLCRYLVLAMDNTQRDTDDSTQTYDPFQLPDNKTIIVTDPPSESFHATNKEYVDHLINSIKWERAVSNFYNPKNYLPRNPEVGERFISTGTGCGWTINRIYEYTGNSEKPWLETCPEKGYIVWVQYASNYSNSIQKELTYIFNGITWDKIGSTIDHSDLRNTGIYTHQKIDDHICNKSLHIKEQSISHRNIKDVGQFPHDAIDKHIQNTTNAHYGQDLTKNGMPEFRSLRVSDVVMSSHVATKDYVDSKVLGLKWNKSVKFLLDPSDGIPEHCIGDRFICLENVKGWKKNYIYEDDGMDWKEIMPSRDYAVYVEGGNIYNGDTILFNGFDWIKFGTTENHNNLSNAGIHTHQEIDLHINNNTDSHFGQDLKVTGSPIFSNLFINKQLTSNSSVIGAQIIKEQLQIGDAILPQSQQNFSNFTIIGNNDKLNTTYIYADESSNDPINLIHMRARGDIYSPKELLSGTPIGSLVYSGHDGTNYNVVGTIQCVTSEDFDHKSHGSTIQMSTTKNGTVDPVINMKIDHDGTINCYCTKDSLSIDDGAMVINGGVGINKCLMVGGNVKVGSNLYFSNTKNISSIHNDTMDGYDNQILSIYGGGENTNKRGSSITISGVNSVMDGKVKISAGTPHGDIELSTNNKPQFVIDKTGKCSISSNEDTSSATTGSLIVNGGMGIGGKFYVGGSSIVLNPLKKSIICLDTQVSMDRAKLSICGGGDDSSNRGGVIQLIGNNNSEKSGSVLINAGNSVHGNIYFTTGKNNANNSCCVVDHSGEWHIFTTSESSNTKSGALVVEGGLGVGKKIVATDIKCLNMLQLALFSGEPDYGEIGSLYYDTTRDCIRVFTKHGWRNVAFK